MPSFIDKTGAQQQVTLSADIFRAAHDSNLTVRQYINNKYPTCSDTETFKQMCVSEQLFFKKSDAYGVNSTPLRVVLDPPADREAANTTRENPVQSRILFPPALMSMVEDTLAVDRMSATNAFDQLVAITTTVASARTEQPVISYSGKDGPQDKRAQQISQLSEPANTMLITASEVTRTIPTFSVGLSISDEAMKYATIDMVALTLARQKEVEMFALAGEAVMAMLNGDSDTGQSALPVVNADTFDTTIAADGVLTDLAWLKWLYSSMLTRRIDWVIVDSLKTALAVQNRTGKNTVQTDDPNSPRIETLFSVAYPQIAASVKMFIAPAEWAMTANTLIGIQSNSAIAKLVNSSASYQASERWAMRKGEGMRFDFGQPYYRLFDSAFSVMSLTNS